MGKELFEKISPEVIETGIIPFSIYIPKSKERLALLCKSGFEINQRHLHMMRESGSLVFIRSTDREEFINYAHDRLKAIIEDYRISDRDKARMVHMFLSRSVRAIAQAPTRTKVYEESIRAAGYLINLFEVVDNVASELFILTENEPYTYSHPQNVAILNLMIGKKMFHNHPDRVLDLAVTGLWHDSGKLHVRKEVIYKRGSFTIDEQEEAERHVFYSERIMRAHGMNEQICLAGRNHHENFNGKGYPDGLSGKLIPLFARITAVSDAYDAITSNRVYRRAESEWKALLEMANDISRYDPKVFSALLEIVVPNDKLIEEFKTKMGLDSFQAGLQTEISVDNSNPFHLPIGA